MIEIAEYLNPTPSPLWKLARQAGVDFAVGGLPAESDLGGGQRPWDLEPLSRMKRAYRDIGFEGVLRPDHVPTVEGDSNENAGYSSFGRLYATGYIRGLREATYAQ